MVCISIPNGIARETEELEPKNYQLWNVQGVMFYDMGRYKDALASFERALALQPNNAGYWFNRGDALRELGQLENALASYNTVLLIDKNYPEAEVMRDRVLQDIEHQNNRLLIPNQKPLRPFGLCAGEFTVPDDFDDSLPEDKLFGI